MVQKMIKATGVITLRNLVTIVTECLAYIYSGEITNLPSPPDVTCITTTNISIDLTTCLIRITPLLYKHFILIDNHVATYVL